MKVLIHLEIGNEPMIMRIDTGLTLTGARKHAPPCPGLHRDYFQDIIIVVVIMMHIDIGGLMEVWEQLRLPNQAGLPNTSVSLSQLPIHIV